MSNQPTNDWATHAADVLERIVQTIRQRATGPALTIMRALVFGTLAGIVGLVALVLFAIAVVRGLNVAIPGDVWIAHAIVGGVFLLLGIFLFSRRNARLEPS
jgi:threonine/homoserine/homoserine lactone efflux protein